MMAWVALIFIDSTPIKLFRMVRYHAALWARGRVAFTATPDTNSRTLSVLVCIRRSAPSSPTRLSSALKSSPRLSACLLYTSALFYWGKRKPCGLWSARFDVRLPAAAATAVSALLLQIAQLREFAVGSLHKLSQPVLKVRGLLGRGGTRRCV